MINIILKQCSQKTCQVVSHKSLAGVTSASWRRCESLCLSLPFKLQPAGHPYSKEGSPAQYSRRPETSTCIIWRLVHWTLRNWQNQRSTGNGAWDRRFQEPPQILWPKPPSLSVVVSVNPGYLPVGALLKTQVLLAVGAVPTTWGSRKHSGTRDWKLQHLGQHPWPITLNATTAVVAPMNQATMAVLVPAPPRAQQPQKRQHTQF